MTKVDEIMALIAANVAACERGAFDKIRSALEAALNTAALAESDAYLRGYNVGHEAALKPGGEPFGTVTVVKRPGCADMHWFYRHPEPPYLDNATECHTVYTAAPPAQTPPLTTCNCRWDGDKQVQQCTLHEAHVDAIREWAERAKSAEAKLKTPPPRLTEAELDSANHVDLDKLDYEVFEVNQQSVKDSLRAVEKLVRKQAGWE